jgi:hypothetical protein
MKRITRFMMPTCIGSVLVIGAAVAPGSTHAIGVSAADMRAIKTAVTHLRHEEPALIGDIRYDGSPLDWAEHLGHTRIADYLREHRARQRP